MSKSGGWGIGWSKDIRITSSPDMSMVISIHLSLTLFLKQEEESKRLVFSLYSAGLTTEQIIKKLINYTILNYYILTHFLGYYQLLRKINN